MSDHDAFRLAGAAGREDDDGGLAQQRRLGGGISAMTSTRRRSTRKRDPAGRVQPPTARAPRDMDRQRDGAGAPDAEEGGEIGWPIADAHLNGFGARDAACRKRVGDAVGARPQGKPFQPLAACAFDRAAYHKGIAEHDGERGINPAWL